MSGKNLKITCIWRTDEFIVSESKSAPLGDEAVLIIDEGAETISASIPSSYSLITKKIIERRLNSIARSGFKIPKTNIRIGLGFQVEVKKEEKFPDVLLQEGHKYSYDIFGPVKRTLDEPIVQDSSNSTEEVERKRKKKRR